MDLKFEWRAGTMLEDRREMEEQSVLHRSRGSLPRQRRGFTLTEAIIAMVLLSLVMVVFGASFPYASQTITRGRHMDLAANACQAELETYRNAGYNSCPAIEAGSTSTKTEFTAPSDLPGGSGIVKFTRVTDSFAETTTDTGRLKVEAQITWRGYGLDKGTVTLTTLIVE